MKDRKLVFGVLAIVIGMAMGVWLKGKGCIAVDGCLDSGGRWNYETKVCEH